MILQIHDKSQQPSHVERSSFPFRKVVGRRGGTGGIRRLKNRVLRSLCVHFQILYHRIKREYIKYNNFHVDDIFDDILGVLMSLTNFEVGILQK